MIFSLKCVWLKTPYLKFKVDLLGNVLIINHLKAWNLKTLAQNINPV